MNTLYCYIQQRQTQLTRSTFFIAIVPQSLPFSRFRRRWQNFRWHSVSLISLCQQMNPIHYNFISILFVLLLFFFLKLSLISFKFFDSMPRLPRPSLCKRMRNRIIVTLSVALNPVDVPCIFFCSCALRKSETIHVWSCYWTFKRTNQLFVSSSTSKCCWSGPITELIPSSARQVAHN